MFRHWVARTVAWVSLGVLVSAGAACGTSPVTAPTERAGQPKVNRLVFAIEPLAIESNDVRTICCHDVMQLRPMYENLIGTDPKTGKHIPQLATEWTTTPDFRQVRFKLREGVRFNGGDWGEFTARDVVHSYENFALRDDSHNWIGWWKKIVNRLEVVNDHEVVFHINPHVSFFNAISENYYQIPMNSKAHFDAAGDPLFDQPPHPGTGAYQYLDRGRSTFIRFGRVPYQHYRGQPDFPELEARWMREASTRLAGLLTGEIHMTKLPADMKAQADGRSMRLLTNTVTGPRVFGQWACCYNPDWSNYNTQWPRNPESPMLNIKVRQALNKALDRDALQKAFAPAGERMLLNHFRPEWPGWNPEWERRWSDMYGYDPARARQLLAEAGMTPWQGPPMVINLVDILQLSNANDMAEAVAGYWRAIGVPVELNSADPATRLQQARGLRHFHHWAMTSTGSDQNYAAQVYNFGSTKIPSVTCYCPPQMVKVYEEELVPQMDPVKQGPVLRRLGDWMFENFATTPFFFNNIELWVNPEIVADYFYPGGGMHSTYTHLEQVKAVK
ncbi:MAG: ABC transporter substrate-binding protein [Dehalococcoidia bacterium]|nr:ABC transporter substrate-binding protein [Dehalococcoidia bacterium]